MATFADLQDSWDNPNDKRYENYKRRLREDPLSVTREEALAARHLPNSNEAVWSQIPAYRNDFDREVLRRELKEKKTDPDEIERELDKNYPHPHPTHLYTKEELEDKKRIGEKLFQVADNSMGFPKISDKIIELVVDNYECHKAKRGGSRKQRKQNKRKSSKQNKRKSSKRRA
jgi:hypothetical protein